MHSVAQGRTRPALELIGGAGLDRETISALALDFDVRPRREHGAGADVVLVVAAGDTYLLALEDIRSRTDAPVIALLRDSDVTDRVCAFEAGADDIVADAFHPAELVARLRALVRRTARPADDVFRFDDLEIDARGYSVRRAGRSIALSPLEMGILLTLARHGGRVVPHSTLIRDVWGSNRNMATVHTFVSYLRAKIEIGGEKPLVHTVRGVGYALRSSRS
jgi:two-component system OmpR family response regulator